MGEVLLFAGTEEGRRLSECLAGAGISHTVCVATQYGELVLQEHPVVKVHRGRMDREEIRAFLAAGDFLAVVDATHPYAREVTRNIRDAVAGMGIPCLRLKRDALSQPQKEGGQVVCFDTNEDCAAALMRTEGNILLTTGSRGLSAYCVSEEMKSRLYVRVLPSVESLSACMEQGICGRQIIAMQGPFTEQMNLAMLRQYEISVLVTKDSGSAGGFLEKLGAATQAGIPVFVIGRPEEKGYSFAEICAALEKLCGCRIAEPEPDAMEIILAGAGMGSGDGLTGQVQSAIREADILFGPSRLLASCQSGAETHSFYLAQQIIPCLREIQETRRCGGGGKAVVLFSGDSGFYSGCWKLYGALEREIREGRLRGTLRVLPGISSVAALAARIGVSWQDGAVYSMHGKKVVNLVRKIRRSPKTFLLTSGVQDVNRLGALLEQAGMEECRITVGYQLSQEGEQVLELSPGECRRRQEEGLYVCMVENPGAKAGRLTHGLADSAFLRDRIPMTKEEVREICICKLHLHDHAVVYDVGSGTGSVALEIAGLSDDIQVYAWERKREAASLIRKNREAFELENIEVVETEAPEGMEGLPAATHAFIGGSGGRLWEILEKLYQINPRMRVVLNAVSLETLSQFRQLVSDDRIENEEVVQVQISRAVKAGEHHLMRAENPVWICAFDFREE